MGRFHTFAAHLVVVGLSLSAATLGETRPKFPPDETLNVPSLTLTDEQFLRGDTANGVAVTLTGELRFPGWNEHLPAVILLHGSDGATSVTSSRWSALLNGMGIATFRLDSFGGRGIDEVETDQSRLSFLAQFYDTYRAVDVLAAHPRIYCQHRFHVAGIETVVKVLDDWAITGSPYPRLPRLNQAAAGAKPITSSLKPVPSLQQEFILDQLLTCGSETCSTDHFFSDAKLAKPPVNLVREGSVLASVELQEAAPFLVSEVSPSDHDKCLSVERINDSTICRLKASNSLSSNGP